MGEQLMTLIARLAINGAPFLIGDVLLTSPIVGGPVILPILGDVTQALARRGLRFGITFKQKVNLLGDRLAVAWSGPIEQAERAIRVLSSLSPTGLQLDDIDEALTAIDPDAICRLRLLGILIRDVRGRTVEASCFSIGVPNVRLPSLGEVAAAGSGRDHFLQVLNTTTWEGPATRDEYQAAHTLLGLLTNEEFSTGNTIAKSWGGGFEAVTFSHATGRLEKVGNILHTFWKLTGRTLASLQLYPMFYRTGYWQDALAIHSARFDEVSKGMYTLGKTSIDLVLPLLKDIGDYKEKELELDFSYKAMCCHVLIENPTGQEDRIVFIYPVGSEPSVQLEIKGDRSGRLHIAGQLSRSIFGALEKRLA
jgi:hypothetical protein